MSCCDAGGAERLLEGSRQADGPARGIMWLGSGSADFTALVSHERRSTGATSGWQAIFCDEDE